MVARIKTVDAIAAHRGRHQHDEGAGGSADLKPAATQRRDQEAANHGGDQPAVR